MDYGSYPPNGNYEDVLSFLARAEERRQRAAGIQLPSKPKLARFFLEPTVNFLGICLRFIAELMPAGRMLRLQDKLFAQVAGEIHIPFEESAPALARARRMTDEARLRGAPPPALLCVMSHPPVDQEWLNLNVEMTRHVFLALAHVRGSPCRPRMVVAVDPYGLDSLGLAAESFYAGFMGTYHLGIDRLGLRRGTLSRLLVGMADWFNLPWRLCRVLAGRREAGIVLAGGVPQTARTMYAVREFMVRLRRARERNLAPKQVLENLREGNPDFKEFAASGAVKDSLPSAWRWLEAWIAARIVGEWGGAPAGTADAYTGVLSDGNKGAIAACAGAMGVPGPVLQRLLKGFEQEFHRETPYRERLFRMLSLRLVRRGVPVLLLPFSHEISAGKTRLERVKLTWKEPVFLPAFDKDWGPVGEFVERFVGSNFS